MWANLAMKEIVVKDLSPTLAGQLLYHAMSNTAMPRAQIPLAIHARGNEHAVPWLDLPVWPSLMKQFGQILLPPIWMDVTSITYRTSAEFDIEAFGVLGFVRTLQCSDQAELSGFKSAFEQQNPSFVAAWGGSCQTQSRLSFLGKSDLHYHPFQGLRSHKKAAQGPLTSQFLREVRRLVEDQSTTRSVMFWTGLSSPFAFVQVEVTDLESKTLKVALGAAKYIQTKRVKIRSRAKELASVAPFWFEAIIRELGKDGFAVEPTCAVSMITNVPAKAGRFHFPEFKSEEHFPTGVEVIVLSSSNFKFFPWTGLLFLCIQ
jgi:hypothetical protein